MLKHILVGNGYTNKNGVAAHQLDRAVFEVVYSHQLKRVSDPCLRFLMFPSQPELLQNISDWGTSLYPSGKFATVEVPKWQEMNQFPAPQKGLSIMFSWTKTVFFWWNKRWGTSSYQVSPKAKRLAHASPSLSKSNDVSFWKAVINHPYCEDLYYHPFVVTMGMVYYCLTTIIPSVRLSRHGQTIRKSVRTKSIIVFFINQENIIYIYIYVSHIIIYIVISTRALSQALGINQID